MKIPALAGDDLDWSAVGITRRDFLSDGAGWMMALAAGMAPASAAHAASAPTAVLINESYLRQKYRDGISSVLARATAFAEQQNGALIDVGGLPSARAIKARLAQYLRRPKRLVILGDEAGVPRFPVRTPEVDIQIDSFYGDLDGDGLAEIAVSRVLGNPEAMVRQLGLSASFAPSPHAMFLGANPRQHLENNRFVSLIGDLGCTYEVREAGDPRALAQADVLVLAGHGNPNGWYSDRPYVTTATVPDLPRQPVIFAGGCSTSTPGAPILRKFLEKDCRAYVGAVSDSYGWTPGWLGNELLMHFIDALSAHPDWTVAELVGEARNRYVRANNLQALILKLEKGESPSVNKAMMHTALQWQAFGDVTARFPQSTPRPAYRKFVLATDPRILKGGESMRVRCDLGSSDGLTTLFFRASWDRDVSAHLQIEVMQNGTSLHKLDWREQREFWAYADMSVGGYWDGGRYYAFALAPLIRREGINETILRVSRTSKPIEVLAGTTLQAWPRRPVPYPVSQFVRQPGINLLWLSRNEDLGPMRGALSMIGGLQFDCRYDLGDMLAPYEFPGQADQLIDLGRYDVILIDDLDNGYRKFPRGMGARLREFVRQGGGLIMTGGPWSFSGKAGYKGGGQGGYGDTPVEEALPVRIAGDTDCIYGKTTVRLIEARHPITQGLDWPSFPCIYGYNRVAAKPGAEVLARTETGDPFIAAWQYGKGRALAVTTRAARDWGADFTRWTDYRRFWRAAIRWASPVADRPVDLSGTWCADDNGTYTIRQFGSEMTFEGVSGDGGKSWTNTFNGRRQDDLIIGKYFDHPPGAAHDSADLSLSVVHGGRLQKVSGTGGRFGTSVWVRNLSGVWRADDGGSYTIQQSGLRIAWEAASADGGKSWTHTFNGLRQGDYIIGKYFDHPPGADRGGGDLSVLVIDSKRLEKVPGTGGKFGAHVWSR